MPVAELKVRKHKEFTTHEWSYSIPATKPAAHPPISHTLICDKSLIN